MSGVPAKLTCAFPVPDIVYDVQEGLPLETCLVTEGNRLRKVPVFLHVLWQLAEGQHVSRRMFSFAWRGN